MDTYYIHIYSNACEWDLFLNDMPISYNSKSVVINTTLGINQYLIKSGKQALKMIVYNPDNNNYLDKFTSFRVNVSKINKQTKEEIQLLNFSIPEQDVSKKARFFSAELNFEALFKHEIITLNKAEKFILNKSLLNEVLSFFEKLKSVIKNDDEKSYYSIFENYLSRRHLGYELNEIEKKNDLKKETIKEFKREIYDLKFVPIEPNATLEFFCDSKLLMLKQVSKTNEKFYGIKYNAKYTDDKSDCEGALNFILYKDDESKQIKAF
jgi:hypothetical protein